MKTVLFAALAAGLATSAQADVIISEVVDGDLSGGNPKFVEITNTSNAPVVLPAGTAMRVYFNGATTTTSVTDLSGLTLGPCDSIVIASSSNDGANQFINAYGFGADVLTPAFFGNGDDVYSLEIGASVVDTYGQTGIDGTAQVWEYTDSFAYRIATVLSGNGGAFDAGGWVYGGVAALDAANDAARIALLQSLTTPGSHIKVPAPATVALAGIGGLIAARRRRA